MKTLSKTMRVISDIHLEKMSISSFKTFMKRCMSFKDSYFLCLCGDIGNRDSHAYMSEFLSLMRTKSRYIIYVAGNHEFYDDTITNTINRLENLCKEENIIFLNRNTVSLHGYNFIGCTLWGKIKWSVYNGIDITVGRNDFKLIRDMTLERYTQLNTLDTLFLEQELSSLETPSSKPLSNIVVTHHLPSSHLIHSRYKDLRLNQFFYTDIQEKYMKNCRYWLSGHTHIHTKMIINSCQCYVNPLGYFDRYPTSFVDELIILE